MAPPALVEQSLILGGLPTVAVGPADPARTRGLVVLLHGWDMRPRDLSPFAHSLGLDALLLFPEGPLDVPAAPGETRGGRAWWAIDMAARRAALQGGARDLAAEHPPGLPHARAQLRAFLHDVTMQFPHRPLVLAGFSQGAMLVCDFMLRAEPPPPVAALALLSISRLGYSDWLERLPRLRAVPVLQSHGRADPDLAFAGAESLRNDLAAAGVDHTWLPFEGGHEIPLVVWRALRKFVRRFESKMTG